MCSGKTSSSMNLFQADPKHRLYVQLTRTMNRAIDVNGDIILARTTTSAERTIATKTCCIAGIVGLFLDRAFKDPWEDCHTIGAAVSTLLEAHDSTNELCENINAIIAPYVNAPYVNAPAEEDAETFTLDI